MADSAIKTVATDVDVAAFIAAVEPAVRRSDADRLCALMSRLSGEPPRLWGPTIIGFGRYRYRYDSGRTGEMCRIGFSPRKASLVIYIVDGFPGHAGLMARLGKHKTGKSCLYVNKLADIDMEVLEQLVTESLVVMAERYP